MPKLYNIYNQVGVFVGPAPSNTGHFLNTFGQPTNNDNPDINFNLVFPLNRVQTVNYGFSKTYTDIKSLCAYGTIARPSLIQPTVNLSFSYYLMGLINEARLGFLVNQPSGITGQPLYGQSTNICPISGFLDRTLQPSNDTQIRWPLTTREPRNIFVATNEGYDDLNDYRTGNFKSAGVDVFAFGDCYINSYKSSASVNQIPTVTVDYICDNIETYNYASGKNIPSINPKDGSVLMGNTFNLPNNFQGSGLPTVVLPSDMRISLVGVPSGDYLSAIVNNVNIPILDVYGDKINLTQDLDLVNLPININDVKLQSYNIDLNLNREPMYNIGYKFPLDRRINFPVFCNLDFNMIVGETATGSLATFFTKDRKWDITIQLNYQVHQLFTGAAIIYKFLGSKFNNLSIEDGIGKLRTANMSFTTELNPNINTRGFFMSGILGVTTSASSNQIVLGTGIADNASPIELIDFSQLLLSPINPSRPIY